MSRTSKQYNKKAGSPCLFYALLVLSKKWSEILLLEAMRYTIGFILSRAYSLRLP